MVRPHLWLTLCSNRLNTADVFCYSFSIARLFAEMCGILLYSLEVHALFHLQCQRSTHEAYEPLTKREREVLLFMCHGYNLETVARQLNIASLTVGKHRQHIYEKLQVHTEHDALLRAFQEGFFSPLAELPNMQE